MSAWSVADLFQRLLLSSDKGKFGQKQFEGMFLILMNSLVYVAGQ